MKINNGAESPSKPALRQAKNNKFRKNIILATLILVAIIAYITFIVQKIRYANMCKINISIAEQKLYFTSKQDGQRVYPISSSKFGLGTQYGSYRTPVGKFKIYDKIGGNEKKFTIFKSRKPVGIFDKENPQDHANSDLVLSRIIRLTGIEHDNQNSLDRFIYIHGTNQEEQIGSEASYGCIRMKNSDVIELFDLCHVGNLVEIN